MNDDLAIVNAFSQTNAWLYRKALEVTDRIGVLARIYENQPLFRALYGPRTGQCTWRRYIGPDLITALYEGTQLHETPAVLHVVTLGLYITIAERLVYGMVESMAASIELTRDEWTAGRPKHEIHQLISSDQPQKLIFFFARRDLHERIARHTRACFGKDTVVEYIHEQIHVGIKVSGTANITTQYNKLHEHVLAAPDELCAAVMCPVQPKGCGPYRYREYACSTGRVDAEDVNDSFLVRIHNAEHTCPPRPISSTSEWIQNNPPGDKEGTQEYFDRYKRNASPALDIKAFRRAVMVEGYVSEHTSSADVWKRATPVAAPLSSQPPAATPETIVQPAYVYFIVADNHAIDQAVKVGCTNNLRTRLSSLQTGNPHRLTIYASIAVDDKYGMETLLHQRLATKRIGGEWFRLSLADIDAMVDEVRSGVLAGSTSPSPV